MIKMIKLINRKQLKMIKKIYKILLFLYLFYKKGSSCIPFAYKRKDRIKILTLDFGFISINWIFFISMVKRNKSYKNLKISRIRRKSNNNV